MIRQRRHPKGLLIEVNGRILSVVVRAPSSRGLKRGLQYGAKIKLFAAVPDVGIKFHF